MADVRFLQIHSLCGYPAALLNRDDSGLAKRITYGGEVRTRVSSQCLKRHWRKSDSVHALQRIDGVSAGVRSREIVTRRVIEPLGDAGHDPDTVEAIETAFQKAIYGLKGDKRSNRQPLLLGESEIAYLADEARKIAEAHGGDPKGARAAAREWAKKSTLNMKAMRDNCSMPGGIAAALFGRMVTSDVQANIDAAVHVAHAFTVHAEESESDYFTVVDDLHRIEDDAGADHIGETELTCGLFYGYVVIDRDTLLRNLGQDAELAGSVADRMVHLIATVSPGAKLGPTAPYGYASWVLVEAGDRQPRSLAEAFRKHCRPVTREAEERLRIHLERLDKAYETGESRRLMSLSEEASMPRADPVSLPGLARWSGEAMRAGSA
ncbi:MAG: type I-E CRISPR-associated protein Cas7/Cse4/CasC [Acidobacteriota bacterium]|nr:type I-E CRISPR-associated protein Cas7/Cse4/CasC [Acidobacteriota bacterium]